MARLSLAEVGLLLLLVLALMLSAEARKKSSKTLIRKKREWIIPPTKVEENTDYTKRKSIAKIRSDKDQTATVEYYLTGKGADQPPYNLFVVDRFTGFVRITDIVDREIYPSYNLSGIAKFRDGTIAEENIPLTVTIVDQNDNPPYFEMHTGSIKESSKKGTFIMQIEGKDNDQAGTLNSEIAYSIVSQEPEGTGHMFTIDPKTGKLYVKEPTLDRETHDFYKLVIKGTDMGGAANGLTGTGTVEIKVLDINDNIPDLEQSEYTGSVDENVEDVVVMRIKALDKDLENTDNWLTVFKIDKGNEDNLFSIETDPETNEGILKLIKPVDFEEIQNLELGLHIENVAPFVEGEALLMDVGVQVGEGEPLATGAGAGAVAGAGAGAVAGAGARVDAGVGADVEVDIGLDAGVDVDVGMGLDADLEGLVDPKLKPNAGVGPGVGTGVGVGLKPGVKPGVKPGPGKKTDEPKSYPIKIAVNNMPEGPAFIPDTKSVPVSEDPNQQPEDGVITVFAAVDPDTGEQAEDVNYAKAYDPDNWFTIDEETAEIKLRKQPDRESPFLVNGTYIAKILAITKDMPSKTATGTIAIQVTDSNDHCPTLTTTRSSLCADKKSVIVTGIDEDVSPNSAPFTFTIVPDGTRGSWDIEIINETSAALHSHELLWPGVYELQVNVKDAQGLSCPADEVFTLEVCTCVETEDCSSRTAKLGSTKFELSAPAIGLLLLAVCLLLFIPLLLLLCQCGGADKIFPDQFSDLPFDAKEHLISYHTEGRGEDKEVPLQSVPIMLGTQQKVEMAAAPNFNTIPSRVTESHQTNTFYDDTVQKFQEFENTYRFSRESLKLGYGSGTFGRETLSIQHSADMYGDIALPDDFLNDYYSQKAGCVVPVKDSLLVYEFEGHGSPTGSVGCCSILESDNDLQFLSDLEAKFKTLAEICSPPIPTPKLSLTHEVDGAVKSEVDFVEPVVKPEIEQSIQTKHTNIKTQKVLSSSNISRSSVSTVSTALPSMTLPHSKVTNISHSSNVNHSATLPKPAQTVLLQHQPVYYTTTPVLQPLTYVVQPQLQNTVLLADGTHGANFPGLYVVSGSQSPTSGLIINGPPGSPHGLVKQGTESPINPASPKSPVSPSLLLPVCPGVSQGSVPVDGWKMIGQNTDGNYVLIEKKGSPGEVEKVDTGSSLGTLPRGAILVKEAAPPQGVLGLAAHDSVYGILPRHTFAKKGGDVVVNQNLGQTWVGQPGQMGLGPITVLGVGAGQSQLKTGHVVAMKPGVSQGGIGPAGIAGVGIRQVSVNQFQGIPAVEQTVDFSGIPKAFKIDSSNADKTTSVVNTVITADATKTNLPPKKRVMTKNQSKDYSDPFQNIQNDTVGETASTDVINYTSEQHRTSEMVQSAVEEDKGIQEHATEKSLSANLKEDIIKSLPGPDVMETSFDRSDTAIEKLGDTRDETVPDQFMEVSMSTLTVVFSQTTGCNDSQENAKEEAEAPQSVQQENPVTSEGFSKEDVSTIIKMSCTEDCLPGSDVSGLGNTDKVNDMIFSQGEEACSDILQDQIHGGTEENVGRQEAVHVKEVQPLPLSTIEGPDERSSEFESEIQSNEVTEDEGEGEVAVADSPAMKVVWHLKANQVIIPSDRILAEETTKEMTIVTRNTHEEVKAEKKKLVESELGLNTVGDKLSASSPNENSPENENESDVKSFTDEETIQELQMNSSEGDKIDGCLAKTDIADVGEKTSLQTVSTTIAEEEEGDLGDQNLISVSEDIKQVQEDELHLQAAKDPGHKKDDNQKNIISVSTVDKDRQDPLSVGSQMEAKVVSDDNISDEEKDGSAVVETMSGVQQDTGLSDVQDQENEEDPPCMSSQVLDTSVSDNEEEIVEEVALSIQQNVSIADGQVEETTREAASRRALPLEDELILKDNRIDETKGENILEDVVSPEEEMTGISDEDEDSEREYVSHTVSQEDDEHISDGRSDEEKESSLRQKMYISDDQDENSEIEAVSGTDPPLQDEFIPEHNISDKNEYREKEDAFHTVPQVEDKIISDESVCDGEKEEIIVEEGLSLQSFSTSDDQDDNTERQDALIIGSQMEIKVISDDSISDEDKDEAPVEETVSPVQQNIGLSNDKDQENEDEDLLHMSSQVDDTSISDNEEEIVEGVALSIQQNFSIADRQVEETAASGRGLPLEDELILEEEVSPEEEMIGISDEDEDSEREDVSHTVSQEDDKPISDEKRDGEIESSIQQKMYISGDHDEENEKEDAQGMDPQSQDYFRCPDNIHDGGKEDTGTLSFQQNISVTDDQDVESAKEDTSDSICQTGEEGSESYQMLEEDSRSYETECLEMNQVVATSNVTEMSLEKSAEVTSHQIKQRLDSFQIQDKTLDIPEGQDNVGQELVRGANIGGLRDVVLSSKELRSSRVATGQVSMSSEDRGASGSIFAPEQLVEGGTSLSEPSVDLLLPLEKGKTEIISDIKITEGFKNASGQASPTYYSEIKVMDETASSLLEKDPGFAESGAAGFIATSEVAEDVGSLVHENVSMDREAPGVDQNTLGKVGVIEAGAEASAGQVSPVQVQAVISQTPRNKSRKDKKGSVKGSKSPSGKCKQQ